MSDIVERLDDWRTDPLCADALAEIIALRAQVVALTAERDAMVDVASNAAELLSYAASVWYDEATATAEEAALMFNVRASFNRARALTPDTGERT